MAKFFRWGGSHGNKKLLYAGGLLLVIFLSFSGVAATDSSNPDSCARCHVMKPYFYTWQNSPHANISCNSCHVEPNTGFASVLARRIGEGIVYLGGDVELPIHGTREISNEACLQCHSLTREITPGLDLQGGQWHTEHLGYGTTCVDCHYEVAHTGMSKKPAFAPTEEAIAQFQEVDALDFSLTKTSCLECHDGERVTYSCEICHTEIGIPQDHYLADFGYNHGAPVRADIAECMRCHTGFGKEREVPGDSIAEITRNAQFCVDCHEGVRPVTHDAFWSVGHIVRGETSPDGCLVCHDWREPEEEGMRAAQIISCAACHEQTPEGHDAPRWYWDHKDFVMERGSFGCFDCHGASSCFDCHAKYNVGFGGQPVR